MVCYNLIEAILLPFVVALHMLVNLNFVFTDFTSQKCFSTHLVLHANLVYVEKTL